jgi:hypothetical protein
MSQVGGIEMRSEWHNLEALALGLVAVVLLVLYIWSEVKVFF